jgi:hypothetical protein
LTSQIEESMSVPGTIIRWKSEYRSNCSG